MKVFKILLVLLSTLTLNLQIVQGQEKEETTQELSLDDGSLVNQFEFIYNKSGNYRSEGKRYKVVRVVSLDKLRQNVLDSLKAYANKEVELNSAIAGHETTITNLNKKLGATTKNLASVTEEKDRMSFVGMMVSKGAYNTIVWIIIAGLLGLLLFFIFKFRRSNSLTQEAKTSLSEVEQEYEDHRRRALEREQKISRQLQDEINKYKKAK